MLHSGSYSRLQWCFLVSMIIIYNVSNSCAGIPRFAIIEESKDIVYLSSHKIYKKVPDNFTLHYVSNGLTPEQLSIIPLIALKDYNDGGDIISSSIVRHWDDATDRISAKLKLIQDEPTLLANSFMIGGFCNPSLVYFKQRYLVASRRPDWSPVVVFTWLKQQSANNADFIIDKDIKYLGIGPGMTELTGVSGYNSGGEDPRLFNINEDTLLMIRTDVTNRPFRLRLAYLQYEHHSDQPHFKLINDTLLQPPNLEQTREHSQKNWSPFLTLQNELQFVYMIHDNFVVIRQKAGQLDHMEVISEVSNDGKVSNFWQFGQVRGGSPAHRIGKTLYLSFFHSQIPTPDTGPYWHSMYMGAYLFTGHAPHQLLAMSRVPLYHDGWFEGAWMQAFQTLYVYFAVNFYFIEISTGKILQNIDLDLCESLDCMKQFNVTLSYGFNDRIGYVATMNLASLIGTLHFFDSGNIITQYADVEDIWMSKDHIKKQCAVENADFDADYNPLDHGYKFFNISTSSSKVNFQMALQTHQFFDKSRMKQHHAHGLASQHGSKSEEVMQSIADHVTMWKVIDWHFQWRYKMKGSESMRCLDIGAKTGFYSLLMAQYKCVVDLFEASQSLIDSVKVSVCLNYLHDRIVIHRTAVADGRDGDTTDIQSVEIQHLPAADDCIFQENTNKNFALMRIDTDGMEVHTLQGLKSTIDSGLIDAIILDFCPGCWERVGLSIAKGFDLLDKLLATKFSPHIVIGSDSCPNEIFAESSKHDVLIDQHVGMKPLSWNNVRDVLQKLKSHRYQCNFVLLHNSHSLSERLDSVPFPISS